MLKYFIIPLIVLATIPALLPNHFKVEKSIIINEKTENIFSELVNLETWNKWSPWIAKEPSAEFAFQGIQGVVGSSNSWNGNKIGSGTQTLIEIEDPKLLKLKLVFTDPLESIAYATFEINERPEGSHVIWRVEGSLSYPLQRVWGLFMGFMIGPDLDDGLKRLKTRLETTNS